MQKFHFSPPTSFLPFLYQTCTLLARPKAPNFQCKRKITSKPRARTKAPRTHKPDTSGIPFEDAPTLHELSPDKYEQEDLIPRIRHSTITATEKAVFERIYKTLPTSTKEKAADDNAKLDDVEGVEPEESLESIFNAAVSSREEKGQGIGTRYHQKHENGGRLSRELDPPTDEHSRVVGKARTVDKEQVTRLFDEARSDMEVWQVLEKAVFSRVEHMNQEMKEEHKLKAVAAKGQSKSQETQKLNKTKRWKGGLTHNSTPPSTTTHQNPRVSSLEILEANYASHCLNAMRIFRTDYPTSPFASALIPQMKRLGSVSYVLGASTALYNEMLYIRWVHFHDLHGVAVLADEMLDHGIGIDSMTITILEDGKKYHQKAAGGKSGLVAQGILQLQGVVAGWAKWNSALQRALSDSAMNDQWREEDLDLNEHEAAEDEDLGFGLE